MWCVGSCAVADCEQQSEYRSYTELGIWTVLPLNPNESSHNDLFVNSGLTLIDNIDSYGIKKLNIGHYLDVTCAVLLRYTPV